MHCCTFRKVIVSLLALMCLSAARQASAELIFFSADRAMSVKAHRFEGDSIIVTLRSGGDMTFDRSLITKIAPDEVPYDEPSVLADAKPETPGPLVNATAYDPMIQSASTKHGVSVDLVKAVIQVESGYQPRARSTKGAMGLMQLMPETARQYGATNPYDPRSNIEAGVKYLRSLLDRFELPLALAAYNAGEAAVRRFGGIPPFPETQEYVRKIRALVR
jgi:soluble lytic murein transglycosylase-like protein